MPQYIMTFGVLSLDLLVLADDDNIVLVSLGLMVGICFASVQLAYFTV